MALTGNKDVDMLILDQMTDADLFEACQVNTQTRNLCSLLLKKRIINRTKLNMVKLDAIKTNMGFTWIQFYLFLYH